MMVSALFELGKGTISETDILEALKGDELQLKPAPSNGLYLWKVIY
jgi:tRNA U38,U39,U40 pseudouridine synthase TruA